MTALNEYPSPRAVTQAIKAAAKRHAQEVGSPVDKIIQMEYRHRFLARMFSPGVEWVLKGGASTLIRLPDARATKDIDLLRQDTTIEAAIEDLKRLAGKDLGDWFTFTLAKVSSILEDGIQAEREGAALTFEVRCGPTKLNMIHVDLVVSPSPLVGEVETLQSPMALALPRLPHAPIRLYPLVDQIADKSCAMVESHSGGRLSSRSRDLVDIVTYSSTYPFDNRLLRVAIITETARRSLQVGDFAGRIPAEAWAGQYAKEAARIPHCQRHPTIDDAVELVRIFIDGAMARERDRAQ